MIKPEFRNNFANLPPEERKRIAREAAKKRWELEAIGAPERGQDFSRPGPIIVSPPKRTRNLTKFFTQIELMALHDLQREAVYYMDPANPVPHKFRNRDKWFRDEMVEVTKRVTYHRWKKLVHWGAYVKPGRLKLRIVEPTPEWPFQLRVVPWEGWWKQLI